MLPRPTISKTHRHRYSHLTRTLLAQALSLKATGFRMQRAAPCSRAAIPRPPTRPRMPAASNPRGETASASAVVDWCGEGAQRSRYCGFRFFSFISHDMWAASASSLPRWIFFSEVRRIWVVNSGQHTHIFAHRESGVWRETRSRELTHDFFLIFGTINLLMVT